MLQSRNLQPGAAKKENTGPPPALFCYVLVASIELKQCRWFQSSDRKPHGVARSLRDPNNRNLDVFQAEVFVGHTHTGTPDFFDSFCNLTSRVRYILRREQTLPHRRRLLSFASSPRTQYTFQSPISQIHSCHSTLCSGFWEALSGLHHSLRKMSER